MSDKEILKELLVDKQLLLEESVAKAKDLIGIDERTGEVVFRISLLKLSARQRIELYLVGKYFSKSLGLKSSGKASIDEMSKDLGIEKNNTSWLIPEMEQEGILRSAGRGKFAITPVRVLDILDDARLKLGL